MILQIGKKKVEKQMKTKTGNNNLKQHVTNQHEIPAQRKNAPCENI